MRTRTLVGIGIAGLLLGWPAWAAVTWARYGRGRRPSATGGLVDRFLPAYEVAETHTARVLAPASLTYRVAVGTGLEASPVVRGIIHARERLLGVRDEHPWPPGGVVAQLRAWGWGVLVEVPGREIVLGAVTQPWEGNVVFHALTPEAFAAFDQPGFVKIVVAIAVGPADGSGTSAVARIHTRVATTDAAARARFRRYWAAFSPGILLIRRAILHEVRREAERRCPVEPRPDRGDAETQSLLACPPSSPRLSPRRRRVQARSSAPSAVLRVEITKPTGNRDGFPPPGNDADQSDYRPGREPGGSSTRQPH